MPDEIKTDAEKVLTDTKSTISSLETDEKKVTGWVKTHVVWAIGLGAFILGAAAGAVLVAHL